MISVIVYGRNDAHGYNLHKRATISLNCIAEVLTHPEDEIIFVDCNTPDDLPTFPEAIQDMLTPKAKSLLRVLRLHPYLYEKYKKRSPLKALEPLARNVAIRRSNPANRWILSTNTDMVFMVRTPGKSLSDVVADLPDGFYELPRFEVPEALWETVDRTNPVAVIATFARWGQSLHLNEAIISRPELRFDALGDFQLMLRDQIFLIHGFNEEMTLGWHVDANLAKRFYLLNGEIKSLAEHIFAYHCSHTRHFTSLHNVRSTQNDERKFFWEVTSPYVQSQAETWGIPQEKIEELRLTEGFSTWLPAILEELLPGLTVPMTADVFVPESYNHGVIYDTLHTFPHLCNHLVYIAPTMNIGYFGGNRELLQLMEKFLGKLGYQGRVLVDQELAKIAIPKEALLSDRLLLADTHSIIEEADLFIFDTGMACFPQYTDANGISFPQPSEETDRFIKLLSGAFLTCVNSEMERLLIKNGLPRKLLLVGSQHTWFGQLALKYLNIAVAPYTTHIRSGYVRV